MAAGFFGCLVLLSVHYVLRFCTLCAGSQPLVRPAYCGAPIWEKSPLYTPDRKATRSTWVMWSTRFEWRSGQASGGGTEGSQVLTLSRLGPGPWGAPGGSGSQPALSPHTLRSCTEDGPLTASTGAS